MEFPSFGVAEGGVRDGLRGELSGDFNMKSLSEFPLPPPRPPFTAPSRGGGASIDGTPGRGDRAGTKNKSQENEKAKVNVEGM